jgi:hypothetical protein
MIPELEIQHTGTEEVERLQENVKKFVKVLEDNPLLDGRIVEEVAFDGVADTTFNHGLGRMPLGCFPVYWETGATMAIAFGQSAMTTNTITAFADVACTLDIWVF